MHEDIPLKSLSEEIGEKRIHLVKNSASANEGSSREIIHICRKIFA